jgi:hypothetical protein
MESSDNKKRPFAVEIPLSEKTQDLNAVKAVLDPKIEKLNEGKDSFQKITYDGALQEPYLWLQASIGLIMENRPYIAQKSQIEATLQ